MTQVVEKKIQSMQDIEIGDIWSSSWGYDQTNVEYYKVIKKTEKMVWLRAIGQKYVESCSDMSEYVMPDPEKELWEKNYITRTKFKNTPNAELAAEDDGEGTYVYAKYPAISKHIPQFFGSGVYIKISSFQSARPWDGRKDFQSHWA